MDVREMVCDWLKSHDYDGLLDDEDCGCHLDDLMPCDEHVIRCEPGYQMKCDCGDHDFHIGSNKRKRLRKRN